MHRLDRKVGRFTLRDETNEIRYALNESQNVTGTTALYWRYDEVLSRKDDVYDEGAFAGKVYHPPFTLPVFKANRIEGSLENRKEGIYANDELHLTCLFDELVKAGLTDIQFTPWNFHLDRVVYDDLVFRIMKIGVLGQVQDRDIIVSIDATQVKPDELVNDAQFKRWSA